MSLPESLTNQTASSRAAFCSLHTPHVTCGFGPSTNIDGGSSRKHFNLATVNHRHSPSDYLRRTFLLRSVRKHSIFSGQPIYSLTAYIFKSCTHEISKSTAYQQTIVAMVCHPASSYNSVAKNYTVFRLRRWV